MSDGYLYGKPDTQWWLSQLRAGIKYRKKYAYEPMWDTWRKYYRGEWAPGVMPSNIFFKMVRTMVPRIYFRNPSISITASKPGWDQMVLAQVLERIDNKLISVMHVKEHFKRMVHDTIMFGTGVGKLGYGAEYTPSPDLISTVDPLVNRKRVEYNSDVRPNQPWFMRIHPGSFIVPAGAPDWASCRWAAHWTRRHVDDVQADPRLKNTSTLKPGQVFMEGPKGEPGTSLEGMVDLVQINDKKTGKVFVIAPYGEDTKKVCFYDDDDLQHDGRLPYYPMIYNQDDRVFWGVPDAMILDPVQREANETHTMIQKHRRISIRKILAKIGAISADEEAKLVDDSTGAVIHVDTELSDVKIFEQPPLPPGLTQADMLNKQEAQELIGLGVNQFGEFAPGSSDRSATEAGIVNQAAQIRTDERRDIAADLLTEMVNDVHHVIFEYWNEGQVVDIAGPYGVKVWLQFKPAMLKFGQYEVKVDPDSSLPETKDIREKRAVTTYQLMVQNPLIDPVKLTRFLLHEMHGVGLEDLMKSEIAAQGGMDQAMPMQQYMQALPQLMQKLGGGGAGQPGRGAVVPMKRGA